MLWATIKASAKLEDALKFIIADQDAGNDDPEVAMFDIEEAYRVFFEEAGLRGVNELRRKIKTYY